MKRLTLLSRFLLIPDSAHAQCAKGPRTFAAAVPKVEAKVEPATARRGETVTWSVTVELAPGWHTYPTRQPDAEATSSVTKIRPPKPGDVVFVGEPAATTQPSVKKNPT